MFKQITNNINEERNKIVETIICEESLVSTILKYNLFEVHDYINSKELSHIIGYDNNLQDFIEIINFDDSLFKLPSQIFNI